ncbi:plastocyanin/azurin family copper-binding protein [Natronorubrum sp. DTA7]|uniref:plastocyanin/azurin family copper-binding protein n=1 Tax=Natronorubrum sp. DTA7 TaxID=3447016 RepID=UPI003F857857
MTEHTRRTVLKAAGATTIAAVAAGCLGDDDDGDGDGNGDDNGDDETFEIDAGTEIVVDGYNTHWEGVEPSPIDGVENPTLVLEEGEEYTIEWVNADDMAHDLQIWDDGGDVVDELTTDQIDSEGDSASLEFTAAAEMAAYVCSLHSGSQYADLVVE